MARLVVVLWNIWDTGVVEHRRPGYVFYVFNLVTVSASSDGRPKEERRRLPYAKRGAIDDLDHYVSQAEFGA